MFNINIDYIFNTALFKLSCIIYFKYIKAKKKKQQVFIFIYLKLIQSILLKSDIWILMSAAFL